MHMLNEPVEPPVKDNTTIEKKAHLYFHDDDEEINNEDYYHSLRPKSANGKPATVGSNDTKKQTINEITDLDRIAAKINSTGQQKWKNSFVPAKSSRFLDFNLCCRRLLIKRFIQTDNLCISIHWIYIFPFLSTLRQL